MSRNKQRAREYNKEYRRRNIHSILARKKKWNRDNPDKLRAMEFRKKEKLKKLVFEAYGNECACCGQKGVEFLAIDHINGGGKEHRKEIGFGQIFYRWLRNNNFPKDNFRLLCHNCNVARQLYGKCPHDNMPEINRV